MGQDVGQWLAVDDPDCYWTNDASTDDLCRNVLGYPKECEERDYYQDINDYMLLVWILVFLPVAKGMGEEENTFGFVILKKWGRIVG